MTQGERENLDTSDTDKHRLRAVTDIIKDLDILFIVHK